jgi:hypothetical protein
MNASAIAASPTIDAKDAFRQNYERHKAGRTSTSRADHLDRRSTNRGTSGARRRPRIYTDGTAALELYSSPALELSFSISEDLYDAVRREAGNENRFDRDGDQEPAFSAGDELTIRIDGTTHRVTLGIPYLANKSQGVPAAQDRWRVSLTFGDLDTQPIIRITIAQLQRIVVPTLVVVPVIVEKPSDPVIPPDPAILLLPAWTATRPAIEIAEIALMKRAWQQTVVFEQFARYIAGAPECLHCNDTGTTGHWHIVGWEMSEEVCPHCSEQTLLIGVA